MSSEYVVAARVYFNPNIGNDDDNDDLRKRLKVGSRLKEGFVENTNNIHFPYITIHAELARLSANGRLPNTFIVDMGVFTCLETLLNTMKKLEIICKLFSPYSLISYIIIRVMENGSFISSDKAEFDSKFTKIVFHDIIYSEVSDVEIIEYGRKQTRSAQSIYIPAINADILLSLFVLKILRYSDFIERMTKIFTSKHCKKQNYLPLIMKAILAGKINLSHGYTNNDNFYYGLFLFRTSVLGEIIPHTTPDANGIVSTMLRRNNNVQAKSLLKAKFMTNFKRNLVPGEFLPLYDLIKKGDI